MKFKSNDIACIIDVCKEELSGIYTLQEINIISFRLLNFYASVSKIDFHTNRNIRISESVILKINNAIKRLKKHEPLEYILGETEFYGHKFIVNKAVLIPRPETEELIHWIEQNHKVQEIHSILDIATGSGCIAISLKKIYNNSKVDGIDISEEALNIAKKNALLNNTEVNFKIQDILLSININSKEKYSIIISNPPYICEKEKVLMQNNVLDYEPSIALFVPDEKPMLFYQAIIDFSIVNLEKNGWLYFEINENYGTEVCEILKNHNFQYIELKKDMNNKDRMIKAMKAF